MNVMIDELAVALERYWSSINRETGPDFVAHLIRFLATLREDARTRGILEDLAREERASAAQLVVSRQIAERSLRDLIATMDRDHEGILRSEGRNVSADLLAHLDDHSRVRDPLRYVILVVRESVKTFFERVCQRVEAHIVADADKELDAALEGDVDASHALRNRINSIDAAYSYSQRARRLDEVSAPGAALAQLEHDLQELHPGPERLPRAREHDGTLNHLRNYYFERQPALMDDAGAIAQSIPLRNRATTVFEEIRRRLGLERSVLSLVNRYRQRVEWYEAHRLRQLALAEVGPGQIEERLTATLAMYLFDHGLNPLTKPMIGPAQPDVLGTDEHFSFYVEAKQHLGDARSYLVQGFNQMWDMFDRVRGTRQEVREAFYVVFRRGGPRYQFPDRVPNEGRLVYPVVINIAEMSESGVHAPTPIRIHESELLPTRAQVVVRPGVDEK